MEILISNSINNFNYDTIVIPFFENLLSLEDRGLDFISEIINALSKKNFTGKKNEIISFPYLFENEIKNIVLAGIGEKEKFSVESAINSSAVILQSLKKSKAENILFYPFNNSEEVIINCAEAFFLADYSFKKYNTSTKESYEIKKIQILAQESETFNTALKEISLLAESVIIARDLVNEPSNIMTPEKLALSTQELGKKYGFEVDVLSEDKIKALKMDAFLAVAGGSANKPKLIVMRYHNNSDSDSILGLVGKGLTYDSGGLSIKPTDSMITMKSDMAGAAAVIGAVTAAARAGLKTNITAVVAACENSISGTSYRPGDIVSTMAGKNIEIMNTDAEGRLTLADAVTYILDVEKASSVIDIATLTGAALVALGTSVTAVISNSDEFSDFVINNSKTACEKTWRLPAYEEHRELIKSDIADLKNTGGKYAGTITAGLFILEFAKSKPLVHLDIAGTSWSDKDTPISPKGGTGEGVKTLYYCAKNFK